jgi:hypothetical protein
MRAAAIVSFVCMAGALAGCGAGEMYSTSMSGNTIGFVSSSPDAVILDFSARPPGGMTIADTTATQQCQIFNRNRAVRESMNTRTEGVIRARYICTR